MRLELDDPRLMDYVLGELEDGEALSLAAALEQEENKEARELVEELRGVTEMTRRILHEEDAGVALSDEQRAAIVGTVGMDPFANVERFRRKLIVLSKAAAAVLLIGAFASVIGYNTLGSDASNWLATRLEPDIQNATQFGIYHETPSAGERHVSSEHILPQHIGLNGGGMGGGAIPAPIAGQAPVAIKTDKGTIYSTGFPGVSNGETSSPGPSQSTNPSSGLQNVEVGGSMRIRGNWFDSDGDGIPPEGEDVAFVEQRTRLGVKADFTDEVSVYNEQDAMQNYAYSKDAQAIPGIVAGDDLYQSYIDQEQVASKEKPITSPPADQDWDDINVGNLSGQAGIPTAAAPPVQAPESERRLGEPPNNSSWQWGVPEGKPTEIVGGPGTETYVKVAGVKPFVAVKDEPLSTFSIDVDTAAYSNVRRFLSQGQLPPADAVRIEEMINYFAYSYPQPTDGRPFAVAVHGAPAPWAPERQLVRIGVKGKEVPASERPQANLVFLLDVSGSMGDANKLPLVKESMKTLLSQLRPNDRVGIVTYAGDARLVLGSTPCSEGAAITQAIESLNSGGSTNGGGGIQMAYDLAQSNFIHEGINRIVLATDGDFNVGTTEHGDLMGMIEARAKSGVFLTTLGFGMGNLKDSTLEQLADRGNGNYAYIDNHAEARKALVEQLSGTLQTIAKDVKIQVEFNPAKVSHYRLLGYENRALAAQDFNDDTKDAGEIGAGHTVTALYEIIPVGATPVMGVDALKYQSTTPGVDALKYQEPASPEVPAASTVEPMPRPLPAGEWLTVKMRYKQPEGSESTKIDVPLMAMNGDLRETDTDFRFASAVAAFGQVLRNSGYQHPGNFDRIIELARGAANGDTDREAFVDLVITAKTLSTQTR